MATLNYAFKELSCKIVYYGCGLCGKTTNLEHIHKTVPGKFRGELVSLATEQDRTLFFDFLPLDLGEVKGFKTKFQLYTVPGQVYYNATRKLVLRGVDGIVFVVDSSRDRFQENIDSLENLKQNLADYGYHLQNGPSDGEGIPWLLQYNKRDLPDACSIDELNEALNSSNVPITEAVAVSGQGVKETLKGISTLVIKKLNREDSDLSKTAGPKSSTAAPKPAVQAPAPVATPAADDDEYGEMSENEPEGKHAHAAPAPAAAPKSDGKPKLPDPQPKAAPVHTPAPMPSAPSISLTQQCDARWRGMKTGSGSLSIANMSGGAPNEYQLTGVLAFLGVIKNTMSRKLTYAGEDRKSVNGVETVCHRFEAAAGTGPVLSAIVTEGGNRQLFVNYAGSGGEVQVSPTGVPPLS